MSLSKAQFEEGLHYAEGNFLDDDAQHLKVDKQLILSKFDLNGKNVLDFGCGMGGMSLWLARHFNCQVHGVDIDAHHITIAKALQQKYNIQNVLFEKRNILELPLLEPVDVVFLNDVAEHIPYPVLKEIFIELEKTLRPDGQIFVSYPPWAGPYASHVSHATGLLWTQHLPKGIRMAMIKKNNRQIIGEIESDLLSAYNGLNQLTHQRLMKRAVHHTQLKPIFRLSHSLLQKVPLLKWIHPNFFPLRCFVTKEFLILKKS